MILKISDRYLKDWYITGKSVKWKKMLGYEIQKSLLNVNIGDVMPSISTHWPSFKSFWDAKLKTALYQWEYIYWINFCKISRFS